MADYVKPFFFTTNTAIGSVTEVTDDDLGFDPEYAMFLSVGAATAGTAQNGFRVSIGHVSRVDDGVSKIATGAFFQSGNNRRVDITGAGAGAGIVLPTTGANLVAGEVTLTVGTGIVCNYTTVDASNAYPVMGIAFASDGGMSTELAHATTSGLTTDFTPQWAICANADLGVDEAFSICTLGIGVSDGTTHGNVAVEDNDINGTNITKAYGNYLPGRLLNSVWGTSARAPTFSSTGVAWSFGAVTAAAQIAACAGLTRGVKVVEFQADNSGNTNATQNLPDFGFTPGTILLFCASTAVKGDPTGNTGASLSYGIASQDAGFGQKWMWGTFDTSGNDRSHWNTNGCIVAGNNASTPSKRGEITAWSNTPQITWRANDTTAPWIVAIAWEEDPATGLELSPDSPAATTATHTPALVQELSPDSPAATTATAAPTLVQELSPDSVAATTATHTPTLQQELSPDSPATTTAMHTPALQQELSPDSPSTTSQTYAPTLVQELTPDSPAATSQTYTPSITAGSELSPDSPAATTATHTPTLQQELSPDSPATTSSTFIPTLQQELSPDSAAATTATHVPAMQQELSPDSPAATTQTHTPVINAGLQITPDSPATTTATHVPALQQELSPDSPAATTATHTPSISNDAQISPDSPAATSTTHAPTHTQVLAPDSPVATSVTLTPALWQTLSPDSPAATTATHAPRLDLELTPDSPAATSTTHTPQLTYVQLLSPDSPVTTSQTHAPQLIYGAVTPPTPAFLLRTLDAPTTIRSSYMPPNELDDRPMFCIYRGNTQPSWRWGWRDVTGQLPTFVGASFDLRIKKKGAPDSATFSLAGDVVVDTSIPKYNLRIDWAGSDTDREPGIYLATLVVTFANGEVETAPYEPRQFRISANLDGS